LGLEDEISQLSTFDDLYKLIEEVILPINGLGPLYVYDTALRIGSYLGLLPEFVYLHAGTMTGALNLGIAIQGNRVRVKDLPKEFHSLEAIEVEDILCIYKDLLKIA
jgi:hypothetical protein